MTGRQQPDGVAGERLEAKRHALAASVAAGAVHDLNNYLARIISLAEMTMDEVADRPAACAELDTLIATAEQAAGFVNRLDSCAGGAISNPSHFDLRATVDAACRVAPAGLELLRPGPPPLGPWRVFADEDLVRLTLDALLRDAHRRSASQIEILCRLLPSGHEAEVILRDDGVGTVFEGLAGAAAREGGGRLEVAPRSGTTTMRLVLPVADDSLAPVTD